MDPCLALQSGLAALFECAPAGERTRVRTPFLYPDGYYIDVFTRPLPNGGLDVSDLGETVRWLRMQSLSPRRSAKQQALVEDVALTHGVEFFKGQLVARCKEPSQATETILRVAQAALRVSDLWFTFKARAVQTINDEVSEFLENRALQFQRSERLRGRSGHFWTPDFHVRAEEKSSLVYVLSTGSRAAARGIAINVLAAWYDLSQHAVGREPLSFVSLFDDTVDIWSNEDYGLLEPISAVARWSRPDEFERLLKEAA